MKRIFCAVCVLLLLVVLLAGCKVKTTVNSNYVDDFIEKYASADQVDKNGNVTYTFEDKDTYNQFLEDYYKEVKDNADEEIKSYHQYSYYNPDITEIVVGIAPEALDEMTQEELKAEAKALGEQALYYQMNTKNPITELSVTYRNANTSEEYFTITVSAE